MVTSEKQATVPVTSENLILSDLALDAAIALERFSASSKGSLEPVTELARALSKGALSDLALVPVYDKALTSGGLVAIRSKNDLYARLREIATKMETTESASDKDMELIRDFCIALHSALLTSRFQTTTFGQ
jgi:hypothetical protein